MRDFRRLETLRTLLVRSCVVVGLCSFILMGLPGVRLSLAALALVAGCWAMRGRPHNSDFWKISSALVSVSTVLIPVLFNIDWSTAGMVLLVYLQVHRARTGETAADDRLALLFALLMVLLASGASRSPWLGLLLLLLVGALPVALLVLQLYEVEAARGVRREPLGARGRRTLLVLMGPTSVLCTVGFFLMIPRLNAEVLAEYGAQQDVSGFSGELQLGELGAIKNNYSIVLRAEITDHVGEPQRGPFYFRGVSLDTFDGVRWVASDSDVRPFRVEPPPLDSGLAKPGQLRARVLLEPLTTDGTATRWTGLPAFAPRDVELLYSDDAVWEDRRMGLRFGKEPRRREYIAYFREPLRLAGDQETPGYFVRATALQLPEGLDPRIAQLADQVVGDSEDPMAKAAKLEQYLYASYSYTLVPDVGEADQPLSVFLFDSRRGHCEYFATALAVLLRSEGVPARIVNGFYTDEFNPLSGEVVARQAHAHSWVEAWIGGTWIRFDATPAGELATPPSGMSVVIDALESRWYGLIVDYDLATQLGGVRSVGRALTPEGPADAAPGVPPAMVGGGVLALCFGGLFVLSMAVLRRFVGARRRRRRLTGVEAVHARARKLVARRGWKVPEALPPVEAARWLRAQAGQAAEPLEHLAWLHYGVRYGGQAEDVAQAQALMASLRTLPSNKG